MNDKTELLPCPFCGWNDLALSSNGARSHYFICNNCGAETGGRDDEEEAVAIWNRRAAAPAAPVAQEPVAWRVSEPSEPEIGHWLSEEPGTSWQRSEPLYTAPPAAEQPHCPPGHELVALPIDRIEREYVPCGSLDLAMKMLDIGLAFALCNRDHAGTRRDVKKAQRYVEEMQKLLAAEQPDTVAVPRATAIALLDEGPRHETWLAQDALRALLAGGAE